MFVLLYVCVRTYMNLLYSIYTMSLIIDTCNPVYYFNQVIGTTTTRQYYSTDPVVVEPKSTQYQLGYEHIPELEE